MIVTLPSLGMVPGLSNRGLFVTTLAPRTGLTVSPLTSTSGKCPLCSACLACPVLVRFPYLNWWDSLNFCLISCAPPPQTLVASPLSPESILDLWLQRLQHVGGSASRNVKSVAGLPISLPMRSSEIMSPLWTTSASTSECVVIHSSTLWCGKFMLCFIRINLSAFSVHYFMIYVLQGTGS
jgi:hypothetical protein